MGGKHVLDFRCGDALFAYATIFNFILVLFGMLRLVWSYGQRVIDDASFLSVAGLRFQGALPPLRVTMIVHAAAVVLGAAHVGDLLLAFFHQWTALCH